MKKLPQHIEELFKKEFGTFESNYHLGSPDRIKSIIATILNEERERVIKKIENYRNIRLNDDVLVAIEDITNLIKEDDTTTNNR